MSPSSLFPSLLSLTLFLSLFDPRLVATQTTNSSTPATNSSSDLVNQVCAKSPHKDFCLSSLQSDPSSNNASDIGMLALIAVKVAAANGTDTSTKIKQLLNDLTLDPGVQQSLSDCSDLYLDAVQQLDDSVAALTVNAYGDVQKWVKTAIANADTCEAGFKGLASGQMLLSHRNKYFRQSCNNALNIVKLLTA